MVNFWLLFDGIQFKNLKKLQRFQKSEVNKKPDANLQNLHLSPTNFQQQLSYAIKVGISNLQEKHPFTDNLISQPTTTFHPPLDNHRLTKLSSVCPYETLKLWHLLIGQKLPRRKISETIVSAQQLHLRYTAELSNHVCHANKDTQCHILKIMSAMSSKCNVNLPVWCCILRDMVGWQFARDAWKKKNLCNH